MKRVVGFREIAVILQTEGFVATVHRTAGRLWLRFRFLLLVVRRVVSCRRFTVDDPARR